MRAVAVFPTERKIEVLDHPAPRLTSPEDVRLRMLEVGICGTDREIARFDYGNAPEGSPYLVIGHESLGEVVEVGAAVTRVKPGDLVVPMVRRPCPVATCPACRAGRQDFCYTGRFTERGINQHHGFMTEEIVDHERYMNPLPAALRDVGILVEPLTIAEKALIQVYDVQERLPWAGESTQAIAEQRGGRFHALVLGAGPVGLLGAMALTLRGFQVNVYSLEPAGSPKSKLVEGIGARYLSARDVPVDGLPEAIGNLDLVYEATGASRISFDVMRVLGTNGAFIFTGVPGRKAPIEIDADLIMRDLVLKNQVVYGTVNAGPAAFANAVRDLGEFYARWPDTLRSLITARYPIEAAPARLTTPPDGGTIKEIVAIAGAR